MKQDEQEVPDKQCARCGRKYMQDIYHMETDEFIGYKCSHCYAFIAAE